MCYFWFFEEPLYCFPYWLYQFTFLPAVLNVYSLLRNLQTVFQSGSTILHHHHQGMRVLVDSHPYQHLVFSVLWMLAILKGMLWYLLVFLICSSVMVNDVEHLFICLFDICVSSLVRYLFISFVHFLLDVSFLLMNFKNSLYILNYSFHQIHLLQIFSPRLWPILFSWWCVFTKQKIKGNEI